MTYKLTYMDEVWTTKEFRYWNATTMPPTYLYWVSIDKIVWSPAPTLVLYGYLPLAKWMTTPPAMLTLECWGGKVRSGLEYGAGYLRWRAVDAVPMESWTPTLSLDNDHPMLVYLSMRCKSIIAFTEH